MTTDKNGNTIRYGRINTAMIAGWMKRPAEDDGPFWALNLMKYRDVADYGDGRETAISGREADDEYTPRDSLRGIGAEIVLGAEVERVLVGDGVAWDRVGIVRYPSRRLFLEMQQRDDFKAKHVHKDAGMEFTIVMSCLPVLPFGGSTERHPFVELSVMADGGDGAGEAAGVFEVEGVIVGDERTWARAAFRWLDEAPVAGAAVSDDPATYRMILRPAIDRLALSVLDAQANEE